MVPRVLLTFIAAFLLTVPVSAQSRVVPRELVDVAHSNGCALVSDPTDVPIDNTPFAYGWLQGSSKDSVVFWCKKIQKSDRPYALVFAVRHQSGFTTADPKQLEGCPAVVEYWNGLASLSVTRRNLELRYFQYVNMPKQTGPKSWSQKLKQL